MIKPQVKEFDEIILAEPNGYDKHIRVRFDIPMPNDNVDTHEQFEDVAVAGVFGDLRPATMLTEWQGEDVILHYNIGNNVRTAEWVPPSIEARRKLLARADAEDIIEAWSTKDLADWLLHFNGYPTTEKDIEACEREKFIEDRAETLDPDEYGTLRYAVYVPHRGHSKFINADLAYEYFMINHYYFQRAYGVV